LYPGAVTPVPVNVKPVAVNAEVYRTATGLLSGPAGPCGPVGPLATEIKAVAAPDVVTVAEAGGITSTTAVEVVTVTVVNA
jgi:hypothetical protein